MLKEKNVNITLLRKPENSKQKNEDNKIIK